MNFVTQGGRLGRLLLALAGAAATAAVAAPTVAHASPTCGVMMSVPDQEACAYVAPAPAAASFGHGYAWAHWGDSPIGVWYTPSAPYQHNSNVGGAANSARRDAVGRYTVRFPQIAPWGTVLATSYGAASGDAYCKVDWWSWDDPLTGTDAHVNCYDRDGNADDSQFTISYTYPGGGGKGGYVWANDPFSPAYVPSTAYQYNSTGATNRIEKGAGTGFYKVIFPNLGVAAGHVQVTGYGGTSNWCKSAGWGPSGSEQWVYVKCFTAGGAPVDTQFVVTFVHDTDILFATIGHPSAYAWADQPFTNGYTPSPWYAYDTNPAADTWIDRTPVGEYAVHFPVGLATGDVQVTSYGGGSERCKIVYWNSSDGVRVNCYRPDGAAVDTRYDVAFVSV